MRLWINVSCRRLFFVLLESTCIWKKRWNLQETSQSERNMSREKSCSFLKFFCCVQFKENDKKILRTLRDKSLYAWPCGDAAYCVNLEPSQSWGDMVYKRSRKEDDRINCLILKTGLHLSFGRWKASRFDRCCFNHVAEWNSVFIFSGLEESLMKGMWTGGRTTLCAQLVML